MIPELPPDHESETHRIERDIAARDARATQTAEQVAQGSVVRQLVNEDKVIAEARMPANEKFTAEQIDCYVKQVREYMLQHDVSAAKVAREIDRSPSTVTEILNGKGRGDSSRTVRLLVGWMELHAKSAQSGMPNGFVTTSVTEKILAVLRAAQNSRTIALVLGPCGMSKSMVCKAATQGLIAGSVHIECTRGASRPGQFVKLWARRLDLSDKGSIGAVEDRIIDLLKNANARLQMIDEAHYLAGPSLDIVRDVHKQAGCGVALVGTIDVEKHTDDADFFHGQFARLISYRYDITEDQMHDGTPLYTVDEIERFAASMGLRLTRDGANRLTGLACLPGWGGLGAASMLLIKAKLIAHAEGAEAISAAHLLAADQSSHTRRYVDRLDSRHKELVRKVKVA